MAWASTVPAALSALVAALKDAPALSGTKIHDGPVVTESSALEAIAVGFTGERMSRTGAYPEPMQPVIEGQAVITGAVVSPQEETYTIQSMIAVLNGSNDLAAARTRAYALLGDCGQILAADKTLGGAVGMTSIGSHALTQDQTPRGAIATLVFGVDVRAFTGR
jgi:hypothetical protein